LWAYYYLWYEFIYIKSRWLHSF